MTQKEFDTLKSEHNKEVNDINSWWIKENYEENMLHQTIIADYQRKYMLIVARINTIIDCHHAQLIKLNACKFEDMTTEQINKRDIQQFYIKFFKRRKENVRNLLYAMTAKEERRHIHMMRMNVEIRDKKRKEATIKFNELIKDYEQ